MQKFFKNPKNVVSLIIAFTVLLAGIYVYMQRQNAKQDRRDQLVAWSI